MQISIHLERAPDDPPVPDPAFQKDLRAFSAPLHAAGAKYSQRAMAFDSIDAHGYPLAEFTVQLVHEIAPVLVGVLVAWLQGRSGRKARLKVGDIEAEAKTLEEVERLIRLGLEIKAAEPSSDSKP